MKKISKALLLVAIMASYCLPTWSQAVPSTEGRDFWVTFLRADEDSGGPEKLTLTISAKTACRVTVENTNNNLNFTLQVPAGNSVIPMLGNNKDYRTSCYSYQNEEKTYTAVHVTATADISLFAGNYRDKSFDAANILPTSALLDDYLVQTYPPSAHADDPQGSHFAIVAVEDGETTVDFNLTAKTNKGTTGAQSVKLNKGQVYYVWTGKKEGDVADLSGTTVKAKNGKKIAVFQGCPHTNLPYGMRDRDHIFSQAMPTAYWGTEFGITSSLHHRRDIIAVMAINDGTEVYITAKDGGKQLVHTFDFSQDTKRYWTFELGEEEAYSTHKNSPYTGKLPDPLVIDSSCYLTTSCPAGVHLFMVSNTYDEPTSTHSDGSISDPAMLWVSPIEQVIKEINFSTYADGTEFHYMNILTTTAGVRSITWTDESGASKSIANYFHPLRGNEEYSFARIEINNGSHNLKSNVGFLAHVYGFGERCSYAYSCGSSTIQRSVTFNGSPLLIDSIYPGKFCVNEPIEMKLSIGNNDYESIVWDYGDGTYYSADVNASNDEKKRATHTYTVPGWYDLKVAAVYVNPCTQRRHDEVMQFSFLVWEPDTVVGAAKHECITLEEYERDPQGSEAKMQSSEIQEDERENCYDDVVLRVISFGKETEETKDEIVGQDVAYGYNGQAYYESQDVTDEHVNEYGCPHYVHYHVRVVTCLEMNVINDPENQHACPGEDFEVDFTRAKGDIGTARFVVPGILDEEVTIDKQAREGKITLPVSSITTPGVYSGTLTIKDENNCEDKVFTIDFAVYYPADIFALQYNNVLAVYKPGYGGNATYNYTFTDYQWYYNDEPIKGADGSVYHTEGKLPSGSYYVVLTRNGSDPLPSCPLEINTDELPDYNQSQGAPAKLIRDNRMCIKVGEKIYDIYGQRVQ